MTQILSLLLTKKAVFFRINHTFWREGLRVIVCTRDGSIEEIEQLETQSLSHFTDRKTHVIWGER